MRPNIFVFMDDVWAAPTLYGLSDGLDVEAQAFGLQLLISGFVDAIQTYSLRDAVSARFYPAFSDYLRERFGWSASRGAVQMILDHEKQSLLARFFKLVRDFETSLGAPVVAGAPVGEQGLPRAVSNGLIFGFIDRIEKRPFMYGLMPELGPETHAYAITQLMHGFMVAVRLYDLSDATSREFLLEFADYLRKRFGWSASQGPIQAIFDHETERPLARFFEIVHDFRGSLDTPPKTRA